MIAWLIELEREAESGQRHASAHTSLRPAADPARARWHVPDVKPCTRRPTAHLLYTSHYSARLLGRHTVRSHEVWSSRPVPQEPRAPLVRRAVRTLWTCNFTVETQRLNTEGEALKPNRHTRTRHAARRRRLSVIAQFTSLFARAHLSHHRVTPLTLDLAL